MSLLEKIQGLNAEQQNKIMEQLQAKFPESIELEAYTHLLIWVEGQSWENAVDPSNEEDVMRAKNLMDAAIHQLQAIEKVQTTAGNFQGMMSAKKMRDIITHLQQAYGGNPMGFTKAFFEICCFMKGLVDQVIAQLEDSMQEDDAMDSEQTVIDTCAVIKKDIEVLVAESQTNENLMKQIEQMKEQYVIMFQEKSSEIGRLEVYKQSLIDKSTTSEAEKKTKNLKENLEYDPEVFNYGQFTQSEKKTAEIIKRIDILKTELTVVGNELTITKRLELVQCLGKHFENLYEVQREIIVEITQWMNNQQKALSGWPQPQSLDNLQPLCEAHAELLWRLYQQIQKMDNMFRPALIKNDAEVRRIDNLKEISRGLFSTFLNKTFMIEKHPQQVLKTTTKFGTTLRHLIGGKLNAHIHPPEVTCVLVSEKYVQKLFKNKGKVDQPPNDKVILNNKKAMEYNSRTKTFSVEFKNLSLTRANRQGGKKEESVCEEKRSLMFFTELILGREKFPIMTLSFPAVVTVHGNQFPDAEATILWDNAFAAQDRKPFEVQDSVQWRDLATVLNYRWIQWNGRGLTTENLAYIGSKLFPDKRLEEIDDCVVTRQMFNRDHLSGRMFTFWKWFYGILDVVKKNMLNEWRDGMIYGFVSKNQAQDLLLSRQPGTFLVRFSDSELGGVTVAYTVQQLVGEKEVWNLSPWTNQHLTMRRFSDRIKDLDALLFLYPEMLKDVTFGDYYTEDEKPVSLGPGEYRDTVLATRVIGATGAGTPLNQSPLHSDSLGQMEMMLAYGDRGDVGFPGSPAESFASTVILDDFGVGGEEVVGDLTDSDDTIRMISNVSALMTSDVNGYGGFNRAGPQDIITTIEDQWSLLSFTDVPGANKLI